MIHSPIFESNSYSDIDSNNIKKLQIFVIWLFFIFGGITSLNDVLIPKLKDLFSLNYTQSMLIQSCFFAAYLIIGIPAANIVKKIGYMRGGQLQVWSRC